MQENLSVCTMNWIDPTHSKTPKRHGLGGKLRYWTYMLEPKKIFFPLTSAKPDRPNLGIWAHFVHFCNSYVVPNFKTFIIFCEKGILGENFWLVFMKYICLKYLI